MINLFVSEPRRRADRVAHRKLANINWSRIVNVRPKNCERLNIPR